MPEARAASWRTEPVRASGCWFAYRQTALDTPPLYHSAAQPYPSQPSGRWHREGESCAQYLSLQAAGAWTELIRYENIRTHARCKQYTRRLWLAFVEETEIADLATAERWLDCGLDPSIATGEHAQTQQLADELRASGYRGILSPSAALPSATNLTLFGERYEKVLLTSPDAWSNPQPGVLIACNLVAVGSPPSELIAETSFPTPARSSRAHRP